MLRIDNGMDHPCCVEPVNLGVRYTIDTPESYLTVFGMANLYDIAFVYSWTMEEFLDILAGAKKKWKK